MSFTLHRETVGDWAEVEWLFDTAFGPGRAGLSSYRLRDGVPPVAALSTLARDEFDAVVGAIRFWPVRVATAEALLLGPIAVHPTRQGEGLGELLIEDTLAEADGLGWTRVILIGDESYYRRFDFRRDLARRLSFPTPTNPDRILARELVEGSMEGVRGRVRKWAPQDDGGS